MCFCPLIDRASFQTKRGRNTLYGISLLHKKSLPFRILKISYRILAITSRCFPLLLITTTLATDLLKPPEATSDGLKLKHFLGKHNSDPPRSSVLCMIPSNKKSCMTPDMYWLQCKAIIGIALSAIIYKLIILWHLQ